MITSRLFSNAVETYPTFRAGINDRKKYVVPGRKLHKRSQPAITVGKLLQEVQPIPRNVLLLGQAADGLPFLLEVGNPEMGAILISCEKGCGKTHQLQVIVESSFQLFNPDNLQVFIFTLHPDEWKSQINGVSHTKATPCVHAWYDRQVEACIQSLTELAEKSQEKGQSSSTTLLLLDDLNYVENLGYEAQINLHWLLEYASCSNIWLVGTINAHDVGKLRYWVDPFRTRILGRVRSAGDAKILAMRPASHLAMLAPAEFRVWTGSEWLSYQLPLLGDWLSKED